MGVIEHGRRESMEVLPVSPTLDLSTYKRISRLRPMILQEVPASVIHLAPQKRS